jgi:hypothetical protein
MADAEDAMLKEGNRPVSGWMVPPVLVPLLLAALALAYGLLRN